MGDHGYAPPPGPPPSYQPAAQDQARASQPHVLWVQPGRSSEGDSSGLLPNAHMNTSQERYQSSNDLPPAYEHTSSTHINTAQANDDDAYAPPPGPPPGHESKDDTEPPPYDPWLAVPDNALLPPPPAFKEDRSPASNASWDDAARAHDWCKRNPLWRPQRHSQQTLTRISNDDVYLIAPPSARNVQVYRTGFGRSRVRTSSRCTDTILLTDIPLYPATTGRPRTIYFEVHVLSMGGDGSAKSEEADASIAIGFVAPPYPERRQPGWHRGSLGVHGDDGRRFVDDSDGGRDFGGMFRKNDRVGIGMTFTPPRHVERKNKVEIFFTRNGRREGSWDLHEERDGSEEGGSVFGLEGDHDLLGAVGCFGPVEFEMHCLWQDWVYHPATDIP